MSFLLARPYLAYSADAAPLAIPGYAHASFATWKPDATSTNSKAIVFELSEPTLVTEPPKSDWLSIQAMLHEPSASARMAAHSPWLRRKQRGSGHQVVIC